MSKVKALCRSTHNDVIPMTASGCDPNARRWGHGSRHARPSDGTALRDGGACPRPSAAAREEKPDVRTAAGTAWLHLAREQTGRVLGDGNQARAPWGALAWTGGPGGSLGGRGVCSLSHFGGYTNANKSQNLSDGSRKVHLCILQHVDCTSIKK